VVTNRPKRDASFSTPAKCQAANTHRVSRHCCIPPAKPANEEHEQEQTTCPSHHRLGEVHSPHRQHPNGPNRYDTTGLNRLPQAGKTSTKLTDIQDQDPVSHAVSRIDFSKLPCLSHFHPHANQPASQPLAFAGDCVGTLVVMATFFLL
jgi:hypothetical protein